MSEIKNPMRDSSATGTATEIAQQQMDQLTKISTNYSEMLSSLGKEMQAVSMVSRPDTSCLTGLNAFVSEFASACSKTFSSLGAAAQAAEITSACSERLSSAAISNQFSELATSYAESLSSITRNTNIAEAVAAYSEAFSSIGATAQAAKIISSCSECLSSAAISNQFSELASSCIESLSSIGISTHFAEAAESTLEVISLLTEVEDSHSSNICNLVDAPQDRENLSDEVFSEKTAPICEKWICTTFADNDIQKDTVLSEFRRKSPLEKINFFMGLLEFFFAFLSLIVAFSSCSQTQQITYNVTNNTYIVQESDNIPHENPNESNPGEYPRHQQSN